MFSRQGIFRKRSTCHQWYSIRAASVFSLRLFIKQHLLSKKLRAKTGYCVPFFVFHSLITLYSSTLSKSVPIWRLRKNFYVFLINFPKFRGNRRNIAKESRSAYGFIVKSRKPSPWGDDFPLWMWGVKEKDMACGFRHYINSRRRLYQLSCYRRYVGFFGF